MKSNGVQYPQSEKWGTRPHVPRKWCPCNMLLLYIAMLWWLFGVPVAHGLDQRSLPTPGPVRVGRVTMSRFNSQCGAFISVCNQPPRSTQPGHPFVGKHNEYQPKGSDALRLGSKGRYGSCVGDETFPFRSWDYGASWLFVNQRRIEIVLLTYWLTYKTVWCRCYTRPCHIRLSALEIKGCLYTKRYINSSVYFTSLHNCCNTTN